MKNITNILQTNSPNSCGHYLQFVQQLQRHRLQLAGIHTIKGPNVLTLRIDDIIRGEIPSDLVGSRRSFQIFVHGMGVQTVHVDFVHHGKFHSLGAGERFDLCQVVGFLKPKLIARKSQNFYFVVVVGTTSEKRLVQFDQFAIM